MKKYFYIVLALLISAQVAGQTHTFIDVNKQNVRTNFGGPILDTIAAPYKTGELRTRPQDSLLYRFNGRTTGKRWHKVWGQSDGNLLTAIDKAHLDSLWQGLVKDSFVVGEGLVLAQAFDGLDSVTIEGMPTVKPPNHWYGTNSAGVLTLNSFGPGGGPGTQNLQETVDNGNLTSLPLVFTTLTGSNRALSVGNFNSLDNIAGLKLRPNYTSGFVNAAATLSLIPSNNGSITYSLMSGIDLYNKDRNVDSVNTEYLTFRATGTNYIIGAYATGNSDRHPLIIDAEQTTIYNSLITPDLTLPPLDTTIYKVSVTDAAGNWYKMSWPTFGAGGSSKWAAGTGNNIYRELGNVGIGNLATPLRSLSIDRTSPVIGLGIGAVEKGIIGIANATNNLRTGSLTDEMVFKTVSSNKFMLANDSGSLKIGFVDQADAEAGPHSAGAALFEVDVSTTALGHSSEAFVFRNKNMGNSARIAWISPTGKLLGLMGPNNGDSNFSVLANPPSKFFALGWHPDGVIDAPLFRIMPNGKVYYYHWANGAIDYTHPGIQNFKDARFVFGDTLEIGTATVQVHGTGIIEAKSSDPKIVLDLTGASTPFTAYGPASMSGRLGAAGGTGGMGIQGFTSGSNTAAYIQGHVGSATPTAEAVTIQGWKSDGGTARTAMINAEKILSVAAGTTEKFAFLTDGVMKATGFQPAAWYQATGVTSPFTFGGAFLPTMTGRGGTLSAVNGGLLFQAFSDEDNNAILFQGHIGHVSPTAAPVVFQGFKSDGADSRTALTGAEKVFSFTTDATELASINASGNFTTTTIKITGGSPGAGKALVSDADGDGTWGPVAGDMLLNATNTMGASGKIIFNNTSSSDYHFKVGGLQIQNIVGTNAYLFNNLKYNGTNYTYDVTGSGQLLGIGADEFSFYGAASGTGGTTTAVTEIAKINRTYGMRIALTDGYMNFGGTGGSGGDGFRMSSGVMEGKHTGGSWFRINPGAGGNYSGTGTAIANVSSITNLSHQYARSGDGVTVSGYIQATVTTGSTLTQIRVSIPVASTFGTQDRCIGIAIYDGNNAFPVLADTTNNEMLLEFTPSSSGVKNIRYHFTYQIL